MAASTISHYNRELYDACAWRQSRLIRKYRVIQAVETMFTGWQTGRSGELVPCHSSFEKLESRLKPVLSA
jgi:hypothetical protein